jgi:hypothetical protein
MMMTYHFETWIFLNSQLVRDDDLSFEIWIFLSSQIVRDDELTVKKYPCLKMIGHHHELVDC